MLSDRPSPIRCPSCAEAVPAACVLARFRDVEAVRRFVDGRPGAPWVLKTRCARCDNAFEVSPRQVGELVLGLQQAELFACMARMLRRAATLQ